MIIGLDGKRAISNFTGLGNYSRSTIAMLAEQYPEHKYLLYTPGKPDDLRADVIRKNPSVQIRTPEFPLFKRFWRQAGMVNALKKDHVSLYHGLSNELPIGISRSNIPSVVTIHDLIFMRHPSWYPWADRQIYKWKFQHACRSADRIIAISQQTKQDIIDFFQTDPEKISVIYQSCDPAYSIKIPEDQKDILIKKYKLPASFLLYVGTVEERKNLISLLKALKIIPGEIPLVVIGRETAYAAKAKQYIEAEKLGHRVIWPGRIPFSELPAFYQCASVFVYPSLYEGFGIPVIEALSSGVPVVTSAIPCFKEAGGSAALYAEPSDPESIAAAVNNLLNDLQLRENHIRMGFEQMKKFKPELIASQLMNLYRSVL